MLRYLLIVSALLVPLIIASEQTRSPGSSCGGTKLENALLLLKIDPSAKDNGHLLAELMVQYGETLVSRMIEKHPALKNPKGRIDSKTISWITEAFFGNPTTSNSRYFIVPVLDPSGNYGANMIIGTLVGQSFPTLTSRPAFLSSDQFHAVKAAYENNDYEIPAHYLKTQHGLSSKVAKDMARQFHGQIFNSATSHTTLDTVDTSTHRLVIYGHGKPGSDTVTAGNATTTYQDIVDHLLANKIADNAEIEIGSCFAACGNISEKLSASPEQLKQAFLAGTIDQYLGNPADSFAHKLAKELYSRNLDFNGKIIAYKGAVTMHPRQVFIRDPHNPQQLIEVRGFGVALQANNGTLIHFTKEDMRIILGREDVMNP